MQIIEEEVCNSDTDLRMTDRSRSSCKEKCLSTSHIYMMMMRVCVCNTTVVVKIGKWINRWMHEWGSQLARDLRIARGLALAKAWRLSRGICFPDRTNSRNESQKTWCTRKPWVKVWKLSVDWRRLGSESGKASWRQIMKSLSPG